MDFEIDFRSETWRALEERANKRLDTLRRKNDAPTLNAEQTAHIRGRIAELKDLLTLPDPVPAQVADET